VSLTQLYQSVMIPLSAFLFCILSSRQVTREHFQVAYHGCAAFSFRVRESLHLKFIQEDNSLDYADICSEMQEEHLEHLEHTRITWGSALMYYVLRR
jgi:hypothetical protein